MGRYIHFRASDLSGLTGETCICTVAVFGTTFGLKEGALEQMTQEIYFVKNPEVSELDFILTLL